MSSKEKRPMRPALGLEKELVKDEISTALHTGVEKLEEKRPRNSEWTISTTPSFC